MKKEVIISTTVITEPSVNAFAAEQALRFAASRRQYRFDGRWEDRNPGRKPEETRLRVELEAFRRARGIYAAWVTLAGQFTFTPVYPEKIFSRLTSSDPVTFFVPWGCASTSCIGERERKAMERIDDVQNTFRAQGIRNRVVLMPADLYATEVNRQMQADQVASYVEAVSAEGKNRGYIVRPWSEIREETGMRYRELAGFYTDERITQILSPSIPYKAYEAARRNSGFQSETDIHKAAFAYLRERICEAVLIEDIFAPVKLSMAPKNKDNDVDMDLPRLYVLPESLILPWKQPVRSGNTKEDRPWR